MKKNTTQFQRLLVAPALLAWAAVCICAAATQAEAREVHITILNTTDLHGNVLPVTDYDGNTDRGGLARVATKIAEIRKETPNVLLVDAGDTIQGSAASFLSGGLVMVKLMNHLKYDAWTLGNHEFDWGLEKLAACIEQAHMPVLNANLRLAASQQTRRAAAKLIAANVRPYVMQEVDGVKLAIVGLNTPGIPNWSRPRLIAPIEFEKSVDTLRRVIPEVRKAGAQVIVLVTHQGWRESGDDHANEIRAITQNFPEIDVIIAGHTHRNFSEMFLGPQREILYCQASYWGTCLGRVDLTYDTEKNKLGSKRSKTILMDNTTPLNDEVLKLAREELDAADKELKTVIGKTEKEFSTRSAPKRETPAHNLLCDAIAESLNKHGAQADVILHGVLNEKAVLKPGPITVGDIWAVVPYENTVGVFEVNLAELKQILEENADHYERGSFRGVWGIRVAYDTTAERGSKARVTSILDKDGNPFPPERRIKVAANSFDLASGGTRFPVLRRVADKPESKLVEYDFQTRQALIDFIKAREVIEPRIVGWWTVKLPKRSDAAKAAEPAKEKPELETVP